MFSCGVQQGPSLGPLLCISCLLRLGHIEIQFKDIYQCFADGIQLCISSKPKTRLVIVS